MTKLSNKKLQERFFEERYKALNKEQKEAVDTINGPVMVMAGPGTGKTSVLTLRIANILRLTDTPPESILALTFTESGAISMRDKLLEVVGTSALRVKISTFHGFANEIIQDYPEYFQRIIGGKVASSIDRYRIIEDIIRKNKFQNIKPSGDIFYYVSRVDKAIKHLKSEGFDSKSFKKWLDKENKCINESNESKFKRSLEMSEVFSKYEEKMNESGLYDFEDMLTEFINVLKKKKNLLLDLKENYLYIMADEHQDANNNQNQILELLTGEDENPNLFVVGDENQSIYRFQGASLENFLYFKDKFPKVKIINLIQNYRSTQKILDASFELVNDVDNQKIKLKSNHKKDGTPVFVRSFENEDEEFDFIVSSIDVITKKDNKKTIAVIYRSNDDAMDMVRKLDEKGIDFSINSDDDIFSDIDIKNLIILLKTVENPLRNELLSETLLFDFLALPIVASLKAIRAVSFNSDLVDILSSPKKFIVVDDNENLALKNFAEKVLVWSKKAKNLNLEEFLDLFIKESGFGQKILSSHNTLKKLEKFRNFYSILRSTVENKKSPTLKDFLGDLELADRFDLKFDGSSLKIKDVKVHLMTAHKAKGLEYDIVFIIKSNEEKWGKKRDRESFYLPQKSNSLEDESKDEKRLFYVALTRAKFEAYITYSKFNYKGKGLTKSSFIDYMGEIIDEKHIILNQKKVFDNPKQKNYLQDFKRYLIEILKQEGLSVTAINNFISCPSKFLFQNLLRMPHSPEKHQNFGTAIHYAIKKYQDSIKKDDTKSDIFEFFEEKLAEFKFDKNDFEMFLERGNKALSLFLKGHRWNKKAESEYKIKNILFESSIGTVPLKGDIDEMVVDNGQVLVTDFKTGKPKTRNYILGKTESSNGDIYRQLLFYKLLIENFKPELCVVSGVIEFVEPDDKMRLHKEIFNLKDESLDSLKSEIKRLVENVSNLNFLGKKCDDKDCEYCPLSSVLEKNLKSSKH